MRPPRTCAEEVDVQHCKDLVASGLQKPVLNIFLFRKRRRKKTNLAKKNDGAQNVPHCNTISTIFNLHCKVELMIHVVDSALS